MGAPILRLARLVAQHLGCPGSAAPPLAQALGHLAQDSGNVRRLVALLDDNTGTGGRPSRSGIPRGRSKSGSPRGRSPWGSPRGTGRSRSGSPWSSRSRSRSAGGRSSSPWGRPRGSPRGTGRRSKSPGGTGRSGGMAAHHTIGVVNDNDNPPVPLTLTRDGNGEWCFITPDGAFHCFAAYVEYWYGVRLEWRGRPGGEAPVWVDGGGLEHPVSMCMIENERG
jgi:hypothetical protein